MWVDQNVTICLSTLQTLKNICTCYTSLMKGIVIFLKTPCLIFLKGLPSEYIKWKLYANYSKIFITRLHFCIKWDPTIVHPFNKYLVSTYYVLGTKLSATSSEQERQGPFLSWMASKENNEPIIIELMIILTLAMKKHWKPWVQM